MEAAHFVLLGLERLWKFDGDLLGKVFETTIANRRIRIHMPSRSGKFFPHPEQISMPLLQGSFRGFEDLQNAEPEFWGRVTAYLPGGTEVQTFETQVLAVEVVTEDVHLNAAMHEWARLNLNPWCASVTQWIEYLANQVSSSEARTRNAPVSQNISTWTRANGTWSDPYRTVIIQCGVGLGNEEWGQALDGATFELALKSVELAKDPPVEHLFLSEARTSFLAREYRKSVVEAAVAIEGLLRQLLHEHDVLDCEISEREGAVLVENMTLGTLIECAKKKVPNWPRHIGPELAKIRNVAAHQNVAIAEHEALDFLSKAVRVVNWFSPKTEIRFIPKEESDLFD